MSGTTAPLRAVPYDRYNGTIGAIFSGTDYWMTVYTQLSKEDVLSWGEFDFIQSIAKYISKGKLPTSAQCKRLVKIITKAEDFGYIMPEQ